jgi:hypothetical protein
MTGELGVLKQNGEQIAGFTSWEINLRIKPLNTTGWQKNKVDTCKASADKYWLCAIPSGSKYQADFYQATHSKLVLVNSHEVVCTLPEASVNKLMNTPIEMIWTN